MPTRDIRPVVKSQYHAALAMLKDAVEKCPDDLWLATSRGNAFWQIAYHTLFYTHLYLHETDTSFRPWSQHQANVQFPSGVTGFSKNPNLPKFPTPYSRAQVLDYLQLCDAMVDGAVDGFDLDSQESGFPWYPIGKLEHQFVNIRHIQHHTAQLVDRLRAAVDVAVPWVGARHRTDGTPS